MNRPRILFLHPRAGSVRYQLDGYCSQPQKGPFRWHPLDFVALASAVHPSADVTVVDLGTHRRTPALRLQSWNAIVGLIGAYGWRHHVEFWREVLAQTSAPVTIWQGDADNWTPPAMADALAAALPGPVTLHRLPGCSHYSALRRALIQIS